MVLEALPNAREFADTLKASRSIVRRSVQWGCCAGKPSGTASSTRASSTHCRRE